MRRSRMKSGKVINNDLDSIGKVMMVAIEDDGKLIVNDRQGFFHLYRKLIIFLSHETFLTATTFYHLRVSGI